ncbi:flagellar brake protein [Megalodesulfovibrio paquesii]
MAWLYELLIGQELIMQFAGDPNRFRSQYFGCKQDAFIIVQMPGVPGIREKVVAGTGLVVRYMSRGKIYGFMCHPLTHALRPCPMIFLSYPHSVETVNLRKTERVDVYLDAQVVAEQHTLSGLIVDLSEGGCGYTASRGACIGWPTLDPGNIVYLDFAPGTQERHVIEAEVVSFKKDIDTLRMGLKFLYTEDSPVRQAVQRYIATLNQFSKVGPL